MDYEYAVHAPEPTEEPQAGHWAVASGYLHKIAHNGTPFAQWHRRYYVLYSDGLLYSFKSARARSANRVIPVGRKCLRMKFEEDTSCDDCTWPKNIPRKLCFSIINSDRSYHFICKSQREMEVWQKNLKETLGKFTPSLARWENETPISVGEDSPEEENVLELTTCPKAIAGEQPTSEAAQVQRQQNDADEEVLPYDVVGEMRTMGANNKSGNSTSVHSSESSSSSLANVSTTVNASEENLLSVSRKLEEVEGDSGEETEPFNSEEFLAAEEGTQTSDPEARAFWEEMEAAKGRGHTSQEVSSGTPLEDEYTDTATEVEMAFKEVDWMVEAAFNDITSPIDGTDFHRTSTTK